ncbi:MAG: rhodanese-like domain-containing protein [Desulfobacteraceae bacterium]|nr:rhodanese-like domain-containing protein [Desulfobacteraceae bacterium]
MKTKISKTLIMAMVTGLIIITTTATAEDTKAPWMHDQIVDANFVESKVSVPMAANVMIIDARPYKIKYTKGHIPGAVSIPYSKFDKKIDLLPGDKSTLLIYYCGGLKCKLSHKSAKKAKALGYTNVKVFAKGFPEWKKQFGTANTDIAIKAGVVEGSIDLKRFKKIIINTPTTVTLIDVRDADEFAKGHFKTAVNIPVEDLESKLKELSSKKTVVFVCSTGARSGEAYYMARDIRPALNTYYVEAEIDYKKDGAFELKKN